MACASAVPENSRAIARTGKNPSPLIYETPFREHTFGGDARCWGEEQLRWRARNSLPFAVVLQLPTWLSLTLYIAFGEGAYSNGLGCRESVSPIFLPLLSFSLEISSPQMPRLDSGPASVCEQTFLLMSFVFRAAFWKSSGTFTFRIGSRV